MKSSPLAPFSTDAPTDRKSASGKPAPSARARGTAARKVGVAACSTALGGPTRAMTALAALLGLSLVSAVFGSVCAPLPCANADAALGHTADADEPE